MSNTEDLARIEELEAEVARLRARIMRLEKNTRGEDVRWYEKIWEIYRTPASQEAARLGREWRQAQNAIED